MTVDKEEEKIVSPPRIFWWRPAAWLKVTGADSAQFLQGQMTNDLRDATAGRAVYALFLDHKGHVQADGFVFRRGEQEFWIASYFCSAGSFRARLESFIIADDVAVEDRTDGWVGLTRWGEDRTLTAWVLAQGGFVFPGRRGSEPCTELLVPTDAEPALREQTAATVMLTAADMERARIEAGIPAVPFDVGPGELPHEAGLEQDAVSPVKGCYVGQEVMARLKAMGQVRRRLRRVSGPDPAPAVPAALFQGERRLGELRTVTAGTNGFIGLALLSTLHLQSACPLSLSANQPGTVTVCT